MSLETECFSMYSDISERIKAFSLPKKLRQARHFCFAHTGRAQEQERTDGTIR